MNPYQSIIDVYQDQIIEARKDSDRYGEKGDTWRCGWNMGYASGMEGLLAFVKQLVDECSKANERAESAQEKVKAMRAELDKINHPCNWEHLVGPGMDRPLSSWNKLQEQAARTNPPDDLRPW